MLCLGKEIGENVLDDTFTTPLSFTSPYHLPMVCTNLPLRPLLFFRHRPHPPILPTLCKKKKHRQRWEQVSLVLSENHSLAITEPQRCYLKSERDWYYETGQQRWVIAGILRLAFYTNHWWQTRSINKEVIQSVVLDLSPIKICLCESACTQEVNRCVDSARSA